MLEYIKRQIITNGHIALRVLRLAIGVGLIVGFIIYQHWMLLFAGVLFLLMGVFNLSTPTHSVFNLSKYNKKKKE